MHEALYDVYRFCTSDGCGVGGPCGDRAVGFAQNRVQSGADHAGSVVVAVGTTVVVVMLGSHMLPCTSDERLLHVYPGVSGNGSK